MFVRDSLVKISNVALEGVRVLFGQFQRMALKGHPSNVALKEAGLAFVRSESVRKTRRSRLQGLALLRCPFLLLSQYLRGRRSREDRVESSNENRCIRSA